MKSPIFEDDAFEKKDVVSKHSIVGNDVYPLLVDALYKPSTQQIKVVSSCLFIFPDRAKINKVSYVNHINGYLVGFEKCLSILHHTAPGWIYRLYVDYSVYKKYSQQTEKDAYDAAETVKASLERIVAAYRDKGVIEVYGVRSKETNNSFMPSIWRYLPMLDPSTEVMCPVDMDQPVSQLIMHFCETWATDQENTCNLMFLQMHSHVPQQCALYLATNMEAAEDGICPIAQFWFWRRTKTTETGAPRAVFEKLFEMCNDKSIRDFFENLEIDWILDEVRKVVVKSDAFSRLASAKLGPQETVDIVSGVVRTAFSQKSKKSGDIESARREAWKKGVLADKRLIEFVALIVAGHVVGDAYDREGNEFMKKMAKQMNNKPNVNLMSDIVLKHGYGIDEWLLHVIMRTPEGPKGCASIMTPSSPSVGLNSRANMILMTTDGAPPIVEWFHDVVDLRCDPNESHTGRLTLTEYMLRACVMLRLLSPDKGSHKDVVTRWERLGDDYLERIERCVGEANRSTLRREVRSQLLNNEGFIVNGCIRRMITITTSQLSPWLDSYGAKFDSKNLRTRFDTLEGFEAFKEVVVRACFLDGRFFGFDKYSPMSVYEGRKLQW